MDTDRRSLLRIFAGAGALVAAADAKELVNVRDTPARDNMRLADLLTARGPVGTYPAGLEIVDHMLYDRIVFPAATGIPNYLPFFSEPIGHCKPGAFEFKTYLDTNSVRANQLPPPQCMLVKRLIVFSNPSADPADLARLFESFYFQFRLDDKVFAAAPLVRRPVVGFLDQMVSLEAARRGNRKTRTPVSLAREIVTELENPIFIQPMQQYAFTLFGPGEFMSDTLDPVSKEMFVCVGLDGEMAYSRQ